MASYFFSRRAAVIHTLLGSLSYGVVLLVKEPDLFWISRWFVMMGSFLIAALIVNWLSSRSEPWRDTTHLQVCTTAVLSKKSSSGGCGARSAIAVLYA